ncbi:hypothetical protein AOLI_G00019750 [Acnodon oligacanthus]
MPIAESMPIGVAFPSAKMNTFQLSNRASSQVIRYLLSSYCSLSASFFLGYEMISVVMQEMQPELRGEVPARLKAFRVNVERFCGFPWPSLVPRTVETVKGVWAVCLSASC